MTLTIKQQAFADYYIQLGNATEAAVKAGYCEKYASTNTTKLLNNTSIRSYIDERLAQIDSERIANTQEVLEYLSGVMRGETKEEVVVVVGVGDGCSKPSIVEKAAGEKERLKAAELLGKRYGIFTDRVDLNTNGQLEKVLEAVKLVE